MNDPAFDEAEVDLLGRLLRGEVRRGPVRVAMRLQVRKCVCWAEPDGHLVLTRQGREFALRLFPDVDAVEAAAEPQLVTQQMLLDLPDLGAAAPGLEAAVSRVVGGGPEGAAIARVICEQYPGGRGLHRATKRSLRALGLRPSHAESIEAAFGLVAALRRERSAHQIIVRTPGDMAQVIFDETAVAQLEREVLWVGCVDASGALLDLRAVGVGAHNRVEVRPLDVFEPVARIGAAAFWMVHNHPSGNLRVSEPDLRLTSRIIQGARLMGVTFMDHLIVSPDGGWVSISEQELSQ